MLMLVSPQADQPSVTRTMVCPVCPFKRIVWLQSQLPSQNPCPRILEPERVSISIVVNIHLQRKAHLMQMIFTNRGMGLGLSPAECRKQQRGQNGDDGDDHQKFD